MAARIPGRLTKLIAVLYVPSELCCATTVGRSFLHLITGISARIVKTTPRRKALEVDLGRFPFEPATMAERSDRAYVQQMR